METSKTRKSVINRLRTIQGHISGVEKMVEQEKPCDEVLLQLLALKSAIHKVGLYIMEQQAMDCLFQEDSETVDRERMAELLKTMIKYSK